MPSGRLRETTVFPLILLIMDVCNRLRLGPFEGAATVKSLALPEVTGFLMVVGKYNIDI
jgi:hypothetical protein